MFFTFSFEVVAAWVVSGREFDVEGEQELCEGGAEVEHRERTADAAVAAWGRVKWGLDLGSWEGWVGRGVVVLGGA